MNYTEFENQFLVASYLMGEETGKEILDVKNVVERYVLDPKPNWIRRALISLQESGYAKGRLHMGDELDQQVYLSPHGVKQAEYLMSEGVEPIDVRIAAEGVAEIPPSEMIFKLDKAESDYEAIRNTIREIRSALSSVNDISTDGNEHDRLVASLASAQTLWEAAQLKAIQVKIGVILALEDASAALSSSVKAVSVAATVDIIKSMVLRKIGVNLDSI